MEHAPDGSGNWLTIAELKSMVDSLEPGLARGGAALVMVSPSPRKDKVTGYMVSTEGARIAVVTRDVDSGELYVLPVKRDLELFQLEFDTKHGGVTLYNVRLKFQRDSRDRYSVYKPREKRYVGDRFYQRALEALRPMKAPLRGMESITFEIVIVVLQAQEVASRHAAQAGAGKNNAGAPFLEDGTKKVLGELMAAGVYPMPNDEAIKKITDEVRRMDEMVRLLNKGGL